MPRKFAPGQSGNPAGKPKGTRNKATRLVLALMEDGAKEVAQAVIDAARAGDVQAARIVIERLAPPLRERPLSIELPDSSTAEGINQAQAAVLHAVGTGDLLPGEGETLSALLENRRRAIETTDFTERLAAIEEQLQKKEGTR